LPDQRLAEAEKLGFREMLRSSTVVRPGPLRLGKCRAVSRWNNGLFNIISPVSLTDQTSSSLFAGERTQKKEMKMIGQDKSKVLSSVCQQISRERRWSSLLYHIPL
jgi:hypothetical protein